MSEQVQTSLVDEYRVLWTTQKKQKLKKWHDGFLRFHRFNKRMLVYDDARHLVADMYLRGRDAIGEGDDLEFENHLVMVEDLKGTVVQDLTPLFSPAVQRKQQIQAGNALLNSPTPHKAGKNGPWVHGTPTQRLIPATRPSQTPLQHGAIDAVRLMSRQAARRDITYSARAQGGSSRPAQLSPASTLIRVAPRADTQKQNPVPRPDLQSIPQPRTNQRPFGTLDLGVDSDLVRFSPDIQHPPSPQRKPLARVKIFTSHPIPNKHTFKVALGTESGSDQFEPPPKPVPLLRQDSLPSVAQPRENKRSPAALNADSETRPFRLSTKRKTSGTPVASLPKLTTPAKKSDHTIPDPREESEKEGSFEPLVNTGTLRLNNTTSRKRNKLLCQRPQEAAPKIAKKSAQKNLSKDSSRSPEDVMVIDEASGPGAVPTAEAPTVDRQTQSSKSRAFKPVGRPTESLENTKGKEKTSGPNLGQEYRICVVEDSPQYKEDNDLGPWSSEAFDLFDWRPPSMKERK